MKGSTKVMIGIGVFFGVLLMLVGAIFLYVIIFHPPKEMAEKAHRASVEGIRGAVSLGIALYRANTLLQDVNNPHYPQTLDNQGDGPCRSCFGNVLMTPLSDPHWTKRGNRYLYQSGEVQAVLVYDPASGKVALE